MARRRYFRYYPRIRVAKKKWASNIKQASITTSTSEQIVINSSQSSAPTPVVLKCGNFKVQGDVMFSAASGGSNRPFNLNFFLLYVPEGVTVSDDLIGYHPEWIMAWTTIDCGIITASGGVTAAQAQKFSLTSRLKRNLNSGDRVVAILQTRDSAVTAQCVFTAQFWTCAN